MYKVRRTYGDILTIKLYVISLQYQRGAVGTLCRIAPRVILPRVLSHVYSVLREPTLLTVTRRDYDIMRHPEGDLYDKSVIQR